MRNLASTAIVLGRLVAVNCGILSAVSHPSPEHTLKSTFVLFRVCSGLGWDTADRIPQLTATRRPNTIAVLARFLIRHYIQGGTFCLYEYIEVFTMEVLLCLNHTVSIPCSKRFPTRITSRK